MNSKMYVLTIIFCTAIVSHGKGYKTIKDLLQARRLAQEDYNLVAKYDPRACSFGEFKLVCFEENAQTNPWSKPVAVFSESERWHNFCRKNQVGYCCPDVKYEGTVVEVNKPQQCGKAISIQVS